MLFQQPRFYPQSETELAEHDDRSLISRASDSGTVSDGNTNQQQIVDGLLQSKALQKGIMDMMSSCFFQSVWQHKPCWRAGDYL